MKVSVIVYFDWLQKEKEIDYPKDLPLPRRGEILTIDGIGGVIYDIINALKGGQLKITIKVRQENNINNVPFVDNL